VKTENDYLIESTAEMIAARPTLVALHREGEMERTPSGGQKVVRDPEDLPAKNRFFQAVSLEEIRTVNWQGRDHIARFILVGMPDDEMKIGDTFLNNGLRYTIAEVSQDRTFETKGFVIQYG
jgi:hypothetical protein